MSDHAAIVREALGLFHSMVLSRERITPRSQFVHDEGRAALAALEQELAESKRLLALRDDAYKSSMREEAIARAEAAEQALVATREALREIADYIERGHREGDSDYQVVIIARAALADKEGT